MLKMALIWQNRFPYRVVVLEYNLNDTIGLAQGSSSTTDHCYQEKGDPNPIILGNRKGILTGSSKTIAAI